MKESPLPPLDNDKLTLILEAAQKMFGHYGIAKTTMNDIASDVGLSKASLYYYYPDKEHLFIAVLEKEMAEFIKAIKKVIDDDGTASKKIKQYVSIRHEYFRRLHSIAHVSIQTLADMKSSLDKFKENILIQEKELIQKILQQGVREGEFEPIPVKSHADLFIITLYGIRLQFIKKGEMPSDKDYSIADHYQKQFTSFFLKAILIKK